MRTWRVVRSLHAAAIVAMCACSTPHVDHSAVPGRPNLPPEQRITQVGFGAEAHFVSCVHPACPLPTPKTLAFSAGASAPAAAATQAAVGLSHPTLNPNGSPR